MYMITSDTYSTKNMSLTNFDLSAHSREFVEKGYFVTLLIIIFF